MRDQVPASRFYSSGAADRISVVYGPLQDYDLLERALNEYEIDVVFHLAAQTLVGIANRSPLSTFDTNIRGTWLLLEAARRVSTVKSIVVASSDKAYGIHETLPYDETFALQGAYPYDVSKSCADLIAASYAATYGVPVAITRCGNFYGGGDLNFNRVVPGTIRSVLRGERPLIRSDGTLTRDYIYIEDAVHAYMTLAEHLRLDSELNGEAFNFSAENPLSVTDVVGAVIREMDRGDLQPIILNEASNEIPHQYLSSEKARRLLGWSPTFTLQEGLRRTIAWYREFFQTHDLAVSGVQEPG
jgi:CDP-glucose 4,6-dehydratase